MNDFKQLHLAGEHRLDSSLLPGALVQVFERASERAVVMTSPVSVAAREPTPLRIQSACLYGEVFMARDCDCRDQLMLSLEHIRAAGGILIHLDQEGRGAGLAAKAAAYHVQQQKGFDTVAAYDHLNLPVDSRDYSIVVEILRTLNIDRVTLLTNNPRKEGALRDAGLEVSRVPLRGPVHDGNRAYLMVKEVKLGHDLGLSRPDQEEDAEKRPVVVVGAAVMDHLFEIRKNPVFGQARQAHSYVRRPGGKGLNQAIALSRLAAGTSIIAEVGTDADTVTILDALRKEHVQALTVESTGARATAQTLVLHPEQKPATFVGWLGHGYERSLDNADINRFATHLGAARALALTLEASESAICHAIDLVPADTLVVLNASPAADPPYSIATSCLEHVNVLIGSADELEALADDPLIRAPGDGAVEVQAAFAQAVADLFDETIIILTSFRRPDRFVIAAASHKFDESRQIVVKSPRVRLGSRGDGSGVSTAIGNSDVFCAALVVGLLNERRAQDHDQPFDWKVESSPLCTRSVLRDVLLFAAQAESFVARGRMGIDSFPTPRDLEDWRQGHPSEERVL